jgi:ATP-dependent protease ClpP protease subunit
MSRSLKNEVDRIFQYGVDTDNRVIWLNDLGEDEEEHHRTEKFIKALHILDSVGPNGDKPINVVMNHSGGSVYEGMAIYDAITNAKNHITVKVFGHAASMGAIILQAADDRLLSENAILMIHHGQAGYFDHSKIVDSWHTFEKKYNKKLDDILFTKIKEKKPRFTRAQLDKLLNFDKIFTPEEAVIMGLADGVIRSED